MIASPAIIATSRMIGDRRYGKLDDAQKERVEKRVAMCQRIDTAVNRRAGFMAESRRTHAGERLSEGAIRKIYYEQWITSGRDWWSLRDRTRIVDDAPALPQAFVDHWHERCHLFRGKHAAAWRSIQREWEQGILPPGFEDVVWTPHMPPGTSYDNLMRPKYRPTPIEDRVASMGMHAAHDLLPGVLTSRVGLPFGSRWVFDDIWLDFKTVVPGQKGLRRLLQFHCIELLSTFQARGMKPEILDDQSGRMERLKERELLFLLTHQLGNFGYHAEKCELFMEHGTASVAERVERLLYDASGGVITVKRGAIGDGALAKGLYAGSGRGNFKFKAALESLGNLIHNENSDRRLLPAQTGSNSRVSGVEDLHGREKMSEALILACKALPAELRDLVRMPATPVWQSIEIADRIQEGINDRKDHDIEGWEACGFTMPEYRLHLDHAWSPITQMADMPEALRSAAMTVLEQDKRLTRARRLSPREVFEGYRHTLTRLPAHLIPQIVGMEHAKERAVAKDGRIHFEDMELGPGEHHYEGLVYTEDGQPVRVPSGEKFSTFVSTLDPARMHLCDGKGSYIGWVTRTLAPSKADSEGFARACGQAVAAQREAIAPVLKAARALVRRDAQDAEFNTALFETARETGRVEKAAKHQTATDLLLSRPERENDEG